MITKEQVAQLEKEGRCIICQKKVTQHQHRMYGLLVHKKCMIEYTAWEVKQDHPLESFDPSFFRQEQIRRNLEREVLWR